MFSPFFGFSGITAPQISVEVDTFKDGTYIYPRHVVKGATVSPITFRRAASIYDSDFYDWIFSAVYGMDKNSVTLRNLVGAAFNVPAPPLALRRDLLVVQFARVNMGGSIAKALGADEPTEAFSRVASIVGGSISAGIIGGLASEASFLTTAGVGAAAAAAGMAVGPFAFASWMPGRTWLLHNCIPVSYKSASDFDANSAAISLMELEVQPDYVEEYTIGIRP